MILERKEGGDGGEGGERQRERERERETLPPIHTPTRGVQDDALTI